MGLIDKYSSEEDTPEEIRRKAELLRKANETTFDRVKASAKAPLTELGQDAYKWTEQRLWTEGAQNPFSLDWLKDAKAWFDYLRSWEESSQDIAREALSWQAMFLRPLLAPYESAFWGAIAWISWADGPAEDWLISKFWEAIGATENFMWYWVSGLLESTTWEGLNDLDTKNIWIALWEGVFVAGWISAVRGAKYAVNPTKKLIKTGYNWIAKKIWNIEFRKADTDKLEETFNRVTSEYDWTFQLDRFNAPDIKDNFYKILEDWIQKWESLDSLKANIKTLGIDPKEIDDVFKKIEVSRRTSYQENSSLTQLLWKRKQ